MATMLAVGLTRENKKRERRERDCLDQHKLENLGDDDPRFEFSL